MICVEKLPTLENFKETFSFICPQCHYQCIFSVKEPIRREPEIFKSTNKNYFSTPYRNYEYCSCPACFIRYSFIPFEYENGLNYHFLSATYKFPVHDEIFYITLYSNKVIVNYKSLKSQIFNVKLSILSHKELLKKIKIYETFA